jgi:hypothetical protein
VIFTPEEVRAIRQGKRTAALVTPSEKLKPGRLRRLRRIVITEDGEIIREQVSEPNRDGDMRAVMLTILSVEPLDIDEIDLRTAQACGYRTASGCKDAWIAKHPKSPRALLVHFAVGDLRDRDRYIAFTGRAGGDYTMNRHRSSDADAPALSQEQMDDLASRNRQKDARRQVDRQARSDEMSLAERMRRLESAPERIAAQVRRELRVVTDRIDRGERRIA